MALNKLCFFDLETTGTDPFNAEIIEAYFKTTDGLEYLMQSQVDVWSYEAEKIHKIPKYEVESYPSKLKAHNDCANWLLPIVDDYLMVCYANPTSHRQYDKTSGAVYPNSWIYFDKACLINSMLECDIDIPFFHVISVYDMVKEANLRGLFTPDKTAKNRVSYSQENVYKTLFGKEYKSHRAKGDTEALMEIYDVISKCLYMNSPITKKDQQSLI